MLMTQTTRICGIFDVANLLQYCPQFGAVLFQWSHAHCQHFSLQICRHHDFIALLPFSSHNFLSNFVLQLVETAICFTICMIQCVFSILIYSIQPYLGLAPIYMPVPSEDKWKSIADELYERWNYPSCIEAIDGKHVNDTMSWIYWSGVGQLTRNVKWKMSSFCLKWQPAILLSTTQLADCQCYQCKFSHFIASKLDHSLKDVYYFWHMFKLLMF